MTSDSDAFFASDDPEAITCFYVHAARVDQPKVIPRSCSIYRAVVLRGAPDKPVRFVIWSWPADKTRKPVQDFRRLGERADSDAYYLGSFLARMDARVKVSLIGYSMGPRIITGALHLLGGGSLRGKVLSLDAGKELVRVRAALWAPAVHSDWLLPGHYHGMAASELDHMVVIHNSLDPVLRRYQFTAKGGAPTALGYSGPACPECLGEDRARIDAIDVRCALGKSHQFDEHITSTLVLTATRNCALWTHGPRRGGTD
jgi:hypothetical protein